jgi:hypothetical protein
MKNFEPGTIVKLKGTSAQGFPTLAVSNFSQDKTEVTVYHWQDKVLVSDIINTNALDIVEQVSVDMDTDTELKSGDNVKLKGTSTGFHPIMVISDIKEDVCNIVYWSDETLKSHGPIKKDVLQKI